MYNIKHRKVRDDPEKVFSDYRIVEVVIVITKQQYGLDFMERITVMRENDKQNSFFEADFKYLSKNDIEDIYQIKINLTAPTLTFPSIEDKPTVGLIYLNNKEEKMIMDLVDISKFYDATLEKVLKEVKLKIFETEFRMKTPLLGKLDLKIIKAYEREIMNRLNLRKQMRR
ncbi:hypothetical protein Tco_1512662 [Tanacetum coccineum]